MTSAQRLSRLGFDTPTWQFWTMFLQQLFLVKTRIVVVATCESRDRSSEISLDGHVLARCAVRILLRSFANIRSRCREMNAISFRKNLQLRRNFTFRDYHQQKKHCLLSGLHMRLVLCCFKLTSMHDVCCACVVGQKTCDYV